MTITPKPEQERLIAEAIQAGLIKSAEDALDIAVDTLRNELEARSSSERASRQIAIQRMRDFGDKYRLTLGEPITRMLLHEGHRY